MNPMQSPSTGPGGKDFGNKEKPRVNFCWICDRKLQGNHFVEKNIPKLSGDDIPRILHKQCYRDYLKD